MKGKNILFIALYFLSCFGIVFGVNSYYAYENHNNLEVTTSYIHSGTRVDFYFENKNKEFTYNKSRADSWNFNSSNYLLDYSKFYSESYISKNSNPFITNDDTKVKVLISDHKDNYFGIKLLSGRLPDENSVIVSKEFASKYKVDSSKLPVSLSYEKLLNGFISKETMLISGIFDGENNKYVSKLDRYGNDYRQFCLIGYHSKNIEHFAAFNSILEFLRDDKISNAYMLKFVIGMSGGISFIDGFDSINSLTPNEALSNLLFNIYATGNTSYLIDIRPLSCTVIIVSCLILIGLSIWFVLSSYFKFDIFLIALINFFISVGVIALVNRIMINGKVVLLLSYFSSLTLVLDIVIPLTIILIVSIFYYLHTGSKTVKESMSKLSSSKEGLVSIIIPTYNGSKFLRHAIDSALNQTYKNIEVIVVNDGSNDNDETDKIAESYGDKIKYLKKENGGVSSALNLGISIAKGEFINWLSHDDEFEKDSVEKRLEFYSLNGSNPKNIISSKVSYIDENGQYLKRVSARSKYVRNIKDLLDSTVNGCSLLIQKDAFKDHKFKVGIIYLPDYFMWASLLNDDYIIINHQPRLIKSRVHKNQITILREDLREKEFAIFYDQYIKSMFYNSEDEILRKIMFILKRRSHLHPLYNKYINEITSYLKESHNYDFWDKLEILLNNIFSWSILKIRKIMSK